MTTAITTQTIRHAVTTIHHGLVDRQAIPADQWNQAVIALAAARTQLGGTPRRLIHRLFLGARSDQPLDLAAIVAALTDYLDTHLPERHPPDPTPGDDVNDKNGTARHQHGQQQLFDA